MKTVLSRAILALGLALSPVAALASGSASHDVEHEFPFDGVFGAWNQGDLQRGFQVYKEVCAGCHGLRYVAFRHLSEKNGPGFTADQVKAIAAEFQVADEKGEPGDTRPAIPTDYFPLSAIKTAPDLSLMAKAREAGPSHIYSILTGFTGEEKDGLYENTAFPGGWISMAPPLEAGVEYQDGTAATHEQMAHDVASFLMWAAEPMLVERKSAGLRNILFIALFTVLLWYSNKKLWKPIKKRTL